MSTNFSKTQKKKSVEIRLQLLDFLHATCGQVDRCGELTEELCNLLPTCLKAGRRSSNMKVSMKRGNWKQTGKCAFEGEFRLRMKSICSQIYAFDTSKWTFFWKTDVLSVLFTMSFGIKETKVLAIFKQVWLDFKIPA